MMTAGVQRFAWRGKPIADVDAWARARGERMVRFHAERTVPNLITGQLETEAYDGTMPESFWRGLLMADGWCYTELS